MHLSLARENQQRDMIRIGLVLNLVFAVILTFFCQDISLTPFRILIFILVDSISQIRALIR